MHSSLPTPVPARRQDWPESWLLSHAFDELELTTQAARRCPDPGYVRAYRHRVAQTLDLLYERVTPGARVLDVAAGQGNLTVALSRCGYRVTWNDLRADLVEYVRLKLGRCDVRFCPGDVFELDVACFDAVLATEVIEHVAHPDQFLKRLGDLVRPGGHVIITTPNGGFIRNTLPRFSDFVDPSIFESRQFRPDADGHIFLLHHDELDPLGRAAGLELMHVAHGTSFLSRGWMGTGSFARYLPEPVIEALDNVVTHSPAPVRDRLTTQLAAVFRRPS
ncbi:MAG: class I SAM-dependent methyltransferase [Solirubrobacteraceae bacterium]